MGLVASLMIFILILGVGCGLTCIDQHGLYIIVLFEGNSKQVILGSRAKSFFNILHLTNIGFFYSAMFVLGPKNYDLSSAHRTRYSRPTNNMSEVEWAMGCLGSISSYPQILNRKMGCGIAWTDEHWLYIIAWLEGV